MLLVPLALLIWASICDLRSRQIPDVIAGLMASFAIAAKLFGLLLLPWWAMLAGLGLGLALGLLLFRVGALGGGDVKIILALGLCIGPYYLCVMLLFMALAGAGLAIVALLRSQKEFAYMPAITFGFLVAALVAEGGFGWF